MAAGVFLLLGMAPVLAAVPNDASDEDWVVSSDATLTGQDKTVEGAVRVQTGATLHLAGTHLRIGGHLEVEPGGRLVMMPDNDRPTRLSPVDEAKGFWVSINGSVESRGQPETIVEGLKGKEALAAAVYGQGGFQIQGEGSLQDIRIRNGTAGVTVRPGGSLLLRDAVVADLGFVGVAAMGHVRLENSTVVGNTMGVSGRATCNIEILNSYIANFADNVLVYFCPVTIEDSLLYGSVASLTANGAARVDLARTVVRHYSTSGLSANPLPAPGGVTGIATVSILDTAFEPRSTARWGLELHGAATTVRNATLSHHAKYGIEANGGSLHLEASVLHNNGEYGVYARQVRFSGADNDFGSVAAGTANGVGAIANMAAFMAQAVRPDGSAVPGLSIDVFAEGQPAPIYSHTETVNARFQVAFESYVTAPDGRPVYLGPFTVRATHPERSQPFEGRIMETGHDLYVDLGDVGEPAPGVGGAIGALAVVGGLTLALLFQRRRRGPATTLT